MRAKILGSAVTPSSETKALRMILSWADLSAHKYSVTLRDLGWQFFEMLAERAGFTAGLSHRVHVGARRDGVRLWVLVNDVLPIVIVDALGAVPSARVLDQHLLEAQSWGYPEAPVGVYVQTVEDIDFDILRASGYGCITRRALLSILRYQAGQLAIAENGSLRRFAERMERLESSSPSDT